MSANGSSITSKKVYRPFGIWRFLPLFVLAGGVAFGLVFVLLYFTASKVDNATRTVFIIGAVIMLLLGILLGLIFRGTRLETSPDGVTYCGSGLNVYSPWDNIKGIGEGVYEGNHNINPRTYQPDKSVEGLLLRNPAVVGQTLADGVRQHMPIIQATIPLFAIVNLSRFSGVIPTKVFFNDATYDDFLKDAKQYAPDVFDRKPRFESTPIFKEE